MSVDADPEVVLEPGIYPDISDAAYHADPVLGGSLSSTGARLILECPAKFRWHQLNGSKVSSEFDFGHAAHELVLGRGGGIVVCDFDDWRTNAAKAERDEARAEGKAPVLAREYATVEAMADALRAHPIASRLLDPERGKPEQSLFWIDGDVWLRARLDWLPDVPKSGRLIVTDYKTAPSAEASSFARSAANFGYHHQAAFYLDGVKALCGVTNPAFVFIVQEKTPPYIVNVIELDATAMQIGAQRNRRAIDIYRQCRAEDRWPTYSDDIELVALPRWAEIAQLEEAPW